MLLEDITGHFRNLNWRYLPYIRPYKAYVRAMYIIRGYPSKIWPYMVQYLHLIKKHFPTIPFGILRVCHGRRPWK